MDWKSATEAPENVVVMTKIDDADGVRNVQPMIRSGSLWFLADRSMYVYYSPTHFAFIKDDRQQVHGRTGLKNTASCG